MHQIGAGALGPVFRAYEPDQDRLVAVKWFRLDIPPEQTHRLVAEFETLIAADLTHPGIAAPIAAGISGASAYFAQDFVAADSLDLVLRDHGAASRRDALRVASQLGAALDFAALVDVTHGALHPRDVLISADDTRVIGLGVASALERVGGATPVRRPYTAPERAAPGPWDRRADVFAVAMLIYEMLLGKRATAIGDQAAEAVASIPGADSPALRRVFACALAEEPARRFATALGFAEALKDALAGDALDLPRASGGAGRARTRPSPSSPRTSVVTPPVLSALPFESDPALAEPVRLAEATVLRVDLAVPDLNLHATEVEAEATPLRPLLKPVVEAVEPPPAKTQAVAPAAAVAEHVRVDLEKPLEKDAAAIEDLHESALATTRSAVWPLMLALGVGLVVGFAGGFGVATRSRLTMAGSSDVVAAPAPTTAATSASTAAVPTAAGAAPSQLASQPAPPPGTAGADGPSVAAASPRSAPPAAGQSAAAAANTTGRITIRSAPAGGHVFVDGRDEGIAPAIVRDLSLGTHVVRVTHEGYTPEERRVALSDARAAQSVTFELAPTREAQSREPPQNREATQSREPQDREAAQSRSTPPPSAATASSGGLEIESLPTGASVFVDGKLVGTTPLVIESVSVGEHSVGITRDGYTRWVTAVRVTGGERARVTASLER